MSLVGRICLLVLLAAAPAFGLQLYKDLEQRREGEAEIHEEALRCRGVACAVAEIGRLDLLASRRLQLAAEAGGGIGLVLRPEPDPSPNSALTRWRAEPLASVDALLWRVILWRVKGGPSGVWPLRWVEQTMAFAPIMSDSKDRAPSSEIAAASF